MKRSKFNETQIVAILKEGEKGRLVGPKLLVMTAYGSGQRHYMGSEIS